MASAALSRRVGKVVGYPPLSRWSAEQRREFHEALLEADSFEDLPGKWQAAILKAEQNRPKLRVVGGDETLGRRCKRTAPPDSSAAFRPRGSRTHGPSPGSPRNCRRRRDRQRANRAKENKYSSPHDRTSVVVERDLT